jgi:hypothetical protein
MGIHPVEAKSTIPTPTTTRFFAEANIRGIGFQFLAEGGGCNQSFHRTSSMQMQFYYLFAEIRFVKNHKGQHGNSSSSRQMPGEGPFYVLSASVPIAKGLPMFL